jgi:ribosome-binding protein aMBF1 (putative translation factor)
VTLVQGRGSVTALDSTLARGVLQYQMSPRQVGATIRRLREVKGMDQKTLARLAKVSQPYLSQLETGRSKTPAVTVAKRLAKALGVSLDDLVK